MAIKINGSNAVLRGYKHKFEQKTAGLHDGKFTPTEQYGTLASAGAAAVLHPLIFHMVGCTNGGAARGNGAGRVSPDNAHKVRCGGQEVLLERNIGSCKGMLIDASNGATIKCECAFKFEEAQPNGEGSSTGVTPAQTTSRVARTTSSPTEDRVGQAVLSRALTITSVSWIDSEGLPELTYEDGIKALFFSNWPFRVMVGLVGTSNPRPPNPLPAEFRAGKQFRALLRYHVRTDATLSDMVIDPGYTPPIDPTKLPVAMRLKVPRDHNYYSGESSAISKIVRGRLHPASSLRVPQGATVLVSALLKFRAGSHTDSVGIKEALSPYHVPWVWCEHALIARDDRLFLLANGSRFPSHAWYIDGVQLGSVIQTPIKISEEEPALSTGQSAETASAGAAVDDMLTGAIDTHQFTIGRRLNVQLSLSVPV